MTLQLKVPGIACSACVNTVTKAIKSVDAIASVEADIVTKMLTIQTEVSEEKIREVLDKAGYPVDLCDR
ncbi:MAG: heavy-metal-associated domain-containing protein [Cyanobacteria bacterium P01_A01_bin.84]